MSTRHKLRGNARSSTRGLCAGATSASCLFCFSCCAPLQIALPLPCSFPVSIDHNRLLSSLRVIDGRRRPWIQAAAG
jgi:hypothetical protein